MRTSLFFRSALPWLALPSLALPLACHRSSSDSSLEVEVTNLALAVADAAGEGHLWLLAVEETAHGGADLNQDGDADDRVLFVHDSHGTAPLNLGLAVPSLGPTVLFVDGDLAAFAVGEFENGYRDLNGDGDPLDRVLHVHDARTGATLNLGLALAPGTVLVGAHCVVFSVSEEAQGADLDGDGQTDGYVVHVHDAVTGTTLNTGLQRMHLWPDMAESNGSIAFGVSESAASGDLNGDGDALDRSVVHVYDAATGVLASSGLALELQSPLFALANGVWGIPVSEEAQGALDVNGDGDLFDFHLHAFDPSAGSAYPLGVEILYVLGAHGGNFVVAQYDGASAYPALVAARSGARIVVGHAIQDPTFVRWGETVVFPVNEMQAGQDLNGDGDFFDALLQLLDPSRGAPEILDVQTADFRGAGEVLVMVRWEFTAGLDWNGNGNLGDSQLFVRDARSGRTLPTSLVNATLQDMDETRGLVLLDESHTRDLNGDGDQTDHVFTLYEWASGRRAHLALAGSPGGLAFSGTAGHRLAAGDKALLFVHEGQQGADLNGDGDLDDSVLHQLASSNGAPPGPAR